MAYPALTHKLWLVVRLNLVTQVGNLSWEICFYQWEQISSIATATFSFVVNSIQPVRDKYLGDAINTIV